MHDEMSGKSGFCVNNIDSQQSQEQSALLDFNSKPINYQLSRVFQDDPVENAQNEQSLKSLDFELYEDSALEFNLKCESVIKDDLDATFNLLAPTRHSSSISCIEFEVDGL